MDGRTRASEYLKPLQRRKTTSDLQTVVLCSVVSVLRKDRNDVVCTNFLTIFSPIFTFFSCWLHETKAFQKIGMLFVRHHRCSASVRLPDVVSARAPPPTIFREKPELFPNAYVPGNVRKDRKAALFSCCHRIPIALGSDSSTSSRNVLSHSSCGSFLPINATRFCYPPFPTTFLLLLLALVLQWKTDPDSKVWFGLVKEREGNPQRAQGRERE